MKKLILMLAIAFTLSGCASLERWVDDAYDSDPRMTEIKSDIDNLKTKLSGLSGSLKVETKTRLAILREEAEMLGDLKKAEFRLKLSEMQAQLEAIRTTINLAK